MANYELMMIVNPSISEEERNYKKLAYKINSSEKWYYILYIIEMDWKEIKNITKEMNLNKNIWRFMFVSKD